MIKYLFFDLDGTISNSHKAVYHSFVRILDEYSIRFDKLKLLSLMGLKKQEVFKNIGIREEDVNSAKDKFFRYLESRVLGGGIRFCVSIKPLISLSKKYPLVMVSNAERSYLDISLKKLRIEKLFKEVYGADEFKTKDLMLKKLFRKYKIKPIEAVYIGDRFSDVECAKKAGCISIAIHNRCSWSSLKRIKEEKPDYIIKDFRELKKLVEKINS